MFEYRQTGFSTGWKTDSFESDVHLRRHLTQHELNKHVGLDLPTPPLLNQRGEGLGSLDLLKAFSLTNHRCDRRMGGLRQVAAGDEICTIPARTVAGDGARAIIQDLRCSVGGRDPSKEGSTLQKIEAKRPDVKYVPDFALLIYYLMSRRMVALGVGRPTGEVAGFEVADKYGWFAV